MARGKIIAVKNKNIASSTEVSYEISGFLEYKKWYFIPTILPFTSKDNLTKNDTVKFEIDNHVNCNGYNGKVPLACNLEKSLIT